ncbi:MAG: hypothetical protein RIS70_2128, partial [Planctomycetota bacterium]
MSQRTRSRRDFLKVSTAVAAAAYFPWTRPAFANQDK